MDPDEVDTAYFYVSELECPDCHSQVIIEDPDNPGMYKCTVCGRVLTREEGTV